MRFSRTTLTMAILCGWAVATAEDGFKPIFDGKTLSGWEGREDLWRVEDGAIVGQTSADDPIKYNEFLIWRQGTIDDFELKLEFKIPTGNSGIQYRSFVNEKVGKYSVGGYQADFEAGPKWSGCNYGEQFRGVLAERGQITVINDAGKMELLGGLGDQDELGKAVKTGDWNEYHIIARGYTFVHKINGQVMSVVTDEDCDTRRRDGILAIQVHAGPPMKLMVRNIQLKRLPMTNAKKVVFVAGSASHGYGQHKHDAALKLMTNQINEHVPGLHASVYVGGWPTDPTAFDNADALVCYSDGGGGHPAIPHLKQIDALAKKGVGIAMIHYAVEVEKPTAGKEFLDWIGGYFETHWSVNPHWFAEFKSLPDHPITRGVEPFGINDEWYYNMRFRDGMKGVTPILTAVPPKSTIERPDGPHSNNPHVREMTSKGMPTHLAWATEREDGGRGFGFTGGHYFWAWGDDDFRKLLYNAVAWVAKADIPEGGIDTPTPTIELMQAYMGEEAPADFDRDRVAKYIRTGKFD